MISKRQFQLAATRIKTPINAKINIKVTHPRSVSQCLRKKRVKGQSTRVLCKLAQTEKNEKSTNVPSALSTHIGTKKS